MKEELPNAVIRKINAIVTMHLERQERLHVKIRQLKIQVKSLKNRNRYIEKRIGMLISKIEDGVSG